MDKIDPKILQMIEAHAAGELPVDPENPDFLVHVYVAVENDDFGGVVAAGFEVASHMGGTGIITLPISEIVSLADRADVLAIFAAPVSRSLQGPPAFTTAQVSTRLKEGWVITSKKRPGGSQGEEVIVGIVDSGVNILHDAFTFEVEENGKKVRKTRILAYWVQGPPRSTGSTPLWQRAGTVFSEKDINNRIAAFVASGSLPPEGLRDKDGHGTAVASVAAGSAWSAAPEATGMRTGVAPAAKFIVVAATTDELAAIEFCFEQAREMTRPCVVNMSRGHHENPHNGLSLFAHRTRAMLVQGSPATFRPGRAFVAAVGNEGVNHHHMKLAITKEKILEVVVNSNEISFGCLISSSQAGLKVAVAPASSSQFSPLGPFQSSRIVSGHKIHIGTLPGIQRQGLDDLPTDFDSHIRVEAERLITTGGQDINVRAGTWRLKFVPGSEPHPDVHIWLTWGTVADTQKLDDPDFEIGWAREDDGGGMELRWRRRKEWIESTLRSQASSREAIVVGGSLWNTDFQLENPWRPSSRGPSTDTGRPAFDSKPDLAAPGQNIAVAIWNRSGNSLDKSSRSGRQDGTSFAAPAVAGTVALMLSHDPTLNQDEIRTILRATTSPWAAKVHKVAFGERDINELNIAGKGLLNIEKAVKAVKDRLGP